MKLLVVIALEMRYVGVRREEKQVHFGRMRKNKEERIVDNRTQVLIDLRNELPVTILHIGP